MADCEIPHVDLAPTFGIQFWGLLISIFFLGASLVQAYLYYTNNSDGWFMRTFVSVTIALDLVGTILVSDSMHFYLITSFGNPAALTQMTQTFIAEIVLALITILLSQHFYAGRVLTTGKDSRFARIAAAIISVGSFASFGSGIAACIKLYLTGRGFESLTLPNYKTMISAWSFANGLCDAIATFSMCYFLSSYKSSFKSTTSVVNSLFLFSINRGFLVFVTQIGLVTAYLAAPSKGYWTPFHLVLPKLHVNTLLAMLNSRASLRNKMDGRVNVVEGSNASNPSHYGTPIRLRSITSSGKSDEFSRSVAKDRPRSPSYIPHDGVQITRSFMTFSDDPDPRAARDDSVKGHAIA